jgi:hypothetical protein
MGSAQSCADFKFFSRGVLSVNAMRLEKRRHVGSMHGLLEDEVLRFMQNSQPTMSHATPDPFCRVILDLLRRILGG